MARPTGRPAGRPPSVRKTVRLAVVDAAALALDVLLKGARLGDAQAAEAVVRLALDLERPAAAPGTGTDGR